LPGFTFGSQAIWIRRRTGNKLKAEAGFVIYRSGSTTPCIGTYLQYGHVYEGPQRYGTGTEHKNNKNKIGFDIAVSTKRSNISAFVCIFHKIFAENRSIKPYWSFLMLLQYFYSAFVFFRDPREIYVSFCSKYLLNLFISGFRYSGTQTFRAAESES
jgi:hypothetical protein